jgi:hypothetical protein
MHQGQPKLQLHGGGRMFVHSWAVCLWWQWLLGAPLQVHAMCDLPVKSHLAAAAAAAAVGLAWPLVLLQS